MRIRQSGPLLLVLAVAACSPGGAVPVAGNPNPLPPPVREEIVPKPPVTETLLVWQPGHWDWVGDGYAWRAGEYVPRAGHGTEWQDGYWADKSGTWTWVPAHWL